MEGLGWPRDQSRAPLAARRQRAVLFGERSSSRQPADGGSGAVGPRGDFQAGALQALFEFRAISVTTTANAFMYSPSADGQRFLVGVQPGDVQPTLNVITNWEKAALRGK